ncbi:MAG: hypothetical protein ACSHXF_09810 [Aquaticitalea sp.]
MSEDKNKHRGFTEDSKLNFTDDSLEGRWSNIQADYRKKYPELEDEDVANTNDFDDMVNRIARRTQRSKQDVEDDIRGWTS